MSKGALHGYFENKEALFIRVVEAQFESQISELDERLNDGSESPSGSAYAMLIAAVAYPFLKSTPNTALHPESLLQASHSEYVQHAPASLYRRYESHLATIIERGIAAGEFRLCDARACADIIAATIDGLLLKRTLGPDLDERQAASALESVLLDGLLKPW